MNKELITKIIGASLILSSLVILILKIFSIPEARENWQQLAPPGEATLWFLGAFLLELVFLVSRFVLGYRVYFKIEMGAGVFYPLTLLTGLSGVTGILLAMCVLILRYSARKKRTGEVQQVLD